ncbi:mitochondrial 54S ribosomal protein YmL32 [Pichia kluyveri]|uniref:Large ribosomal subunit protein bL32m n=1 Tax=Pichia kluyveri TaxID=36015 RepID=A0AAV5RBA1_PICKL|nr:mitochondrial 54S ribosomal protein YmL32 [Pichia kluyveri]
MVSALLPSLPAAGLSALLPRLPSIRIGVALPSFLQPTSNENTIEDINNNNELDSGILRAAPKKKTSHMKRRQRLYGPGDKHIKLKDNLNRCPACGHYKRSHFLCMNCVGQIRKYWKNRDAPAPREAEEFTNPLDEQIIYPGKTERESEKKLQSKDWLVKKPKTLPVE